MKILSKEEGEIWLQKSSLPIEGADLRIFYKNSMVYEYIQTNGKIIALAKFISNYFEVVNEEGALWITDWDIYPENMDLFTIFRKGLNEKRTLQEAPFHVFDGAEKDKLENFIDIAMFFTWDTYLILPKRGIVFSPNDENLHVSCKEKEDYQQFKEYFNSMDFKDITDYWNKRMAKIKSEQNPQETNLL
jgi:hypothetical protein